MINIIMPVYNTDKYLEEAIDSIVGQSLFTQGCVQLYLLDDASSDHSLEICREYESKYSDRIRVIHFEENKGVSVVRNYGVSLICDAEDEIVGFVDSDDKLAPDALEKVNKYFWDHKDINVAAMEIFYFDAIEKEHKLNWRFRQRDVVDIKKDYTFPHYYIGGTFMRREALKRLHFQEDMSFWEDALAVNQIIVDEGKYGLISGAIYYYRKRRDESSLVNQAWRGEERYTTFLNDGYMRLMDDCKKKKHRVLPYIQFVVAYHVRVFMMKSKSEIVDEVMETDEAMAQFRDRLQVVLKRISEKVIINLPTSLPIIEAMLSMRKGRQVRAKRIYRDGDCLLVYKGKILTRMSERKVRLFYIVDNGSDFDGMWRGRFCSPAYAMHREDYIFAEHDGQKIASVEYPCRRQLFILGKRLRCWYHAGFAISIPKEWDRAVFGIHMDEADQDIYMNEIVFAEVGKSKEEDSEEVEEDTREDE